MKRREKQKSRHEVTKSMVECAVLIALGTVLSMLKLVDMPYGGSVTPASMLPIVIASYRCGLPMGILSGVVFALIQQLLGISNLSYFTTWQSILAIIVLDYVVAFTVLGIGGVFRGKMRKKSTFLPLSQKKELATGTVIVCILRYLCHVLSGATVWAGLSIPTEAALLYSVGYNATYMLPETVITVAVALFIGEMIDLTKNVPTRFSPSRYGACEVPRVNRLTRAAVFVILALIIFDTIYISPYLQDETTGEFTFSHLSDMNILLLVAVNSVLLISSLAIYFAGKIRAGVNRTRGR